MKRVKIKCKLSNSINNYKYEIIIYNCYCEKIFNEFTDENGILFFDAPYYGVYKILILKNKNQRLCTNFYIGNNVDEDFYFLITNLKKDFHLITFKITDKNYKGLPIKEGKITLCKNI